MTFRTIYRVTMRFRNDTRTSVHYFSGVCAMFPFIRIISRYSDILNIEIIPESMVPYDEAVFNH
jgi:hypothetical protein